MTHHILSLVLRQSLTYTFITPRCDTNVALTPIAELLVVRSPSVAGLSAPQGRKAVNVERLMPLDLVTSVCPFRSFFFFQAEDGIRDADVTGVQTCALPI